MGTGGLTDELLKQCAEAGTHSLHNSSRNASLFFARTSSSFQYYLLSTTPYPPTLHCADRYDFWLRALVRGFSENRGAGRVWVGGAFLPETFQPGLRPCG